MPSEAGFWLKSNTQHLVCNAGTGGDWLRQAQGYSPAYAFVPSKTLTAKLIKTKPPIRQYTAVRPAAPLFTQLAPGPTAKTDTPNPINASPPTTMPIPRATRWFRSSPQSGWLS